MNDYYVIDGIEINIGIAIYPGNNETLEGLLLMADSAMYAAKNSGRNNYKYYEE